jgi:hypothetical protein
MVEDHHVVGVIRVVWVDRVMKIIAVMFLRILHTSVRLTM